MRTFHVLLLTVLCACVVKAQEKSEAASDLPPGWWQIPKTETRLKIGGYVKLDFIHDFNPIASPDFFDVSKIPTDGSEGQSTHLHAKETRLNLDVRTDTKVGELRAFIEGDFYGTNGALRLRHAFVEIGGKWLAGQWWSNFMDESMIPNTLDFEKPGAYLFARNPMLRYKLAVSKDAYFGIAVEEPHANAQNPAQAGDFENPLPDLTARYRLTKSWGHLQLSGFVAKLTYRFDAGGTDDVSLYGGAVSGQLNFAKTDKFFYQVAYGPGVARFRGGLSAGLNAAGELEALTDLGFTLGVEHHWSPSLYSVVVFNHGEVDNTEGQPFSSASLVSYAAADLIWNFTPKAFVGVEYLWGMRKDLDESDGTANRVQLSVRYSF
jgi:hypothetical protein